MLGTVVICHVIVPHNQLRDVMAYAEQRNMQSQFVMLWGCISVHGIGYLHMSEGTTDIER